MSQVKDGNYNTGDHNMNQFDEILERITCFKYVNVSFIENPQLIIISFVSTPHIKELFSKNYFQMLLGTIL